MGSDNRHRGFGGLAVLQYACQGAAYESSYDWMTLSVAHAFFFFLTLALNVAFSYVAIECFNQTLLIPYIACFSSGTLFGALPA